MVICRLVKPAFHGMELRRHLKGVIQNERLMEPSGFESTTSRAACYDGRFVMMRDHQTAPFHWARAIAERRIGYDNVLWHGDLHPDTKMPPVTVDRSIFGADGLPADPHKLVEEAARVVKQNDCYPDLGPEESFVHLGIELREVGAYVHLIPGDDDRFAAEDLPVPSITMTFLTALKAAREGRGKRGIGDLDFDLFSSSPTMPYERQADLAGDLDDLVEIFRRVDPGCITAPFSPCSSGFVHTYNTRPLDENVEIAARMIEGLGIDARRLVFIDEPRRDHRFSPK